MDVLGFLFAAVGAVLICSHGRWAPYGFMTVLVSNAAWVVYSLGLGRAGVWLVVQYVFFFGVNCWGLSGALKRRKADAVRADDEARQREALASSSRTIVS